jgi:hypothetical protein|tara:strand:- start:7219 stop:7935 length:717 start_codon:yes stop_codon:yes gene_type:complete
MANNASIGICGVVVGVILGAGTILYTQDYSMTAHLAGSILDNQIAFRGLDMTGIDTRAYNRRNIAAREDTTYSESQVVNDPRYPRTPSRVAASEVKAQAVSKKCAERLRVISQIREVLKRSIPANHSDMDIRRRVIAVLDDAAVSCQAYRGKIYDQRGPSSVQLNKLKVKRSQSVTGISPKRRQPAQVIYQAQDVSTGVNNDCNKYGITTQRYTRCIVAQREGQRYIGRQTRKYEMLR